MQVSVRNDEPILSQCSLDGIDYQVDPYIGCEHLCLYCYALTQAETDWSKEILIHQNIVGRLNEELGRISPQKIYLGYHSDPYQPVEAEFCQTRKVLELLLRRGFSASILTKSDLVVRDLDILREMDDASVSVSVAFNDDRIRRLFEVNTPETGKRIDILHQIKDAGVKTGALLCPVIPYITDAAQLIEMLAPCTERIWIYGLSFSDYSDQNWVETQKVLKREFPDFSGKIEQAVFSREHSYWEQLRNDLTAIKNERKLNLNIYL